MKKKDKLKSIDIRFFLIPFLVLLLLFTIVSYRSTKDHIKNTYAMIERYSLGMAESYTRRITNSNAAADFITGLIDEKLSLVSDTAIHLENKDSDETLVMLAEKYLVDEISIYNNHGEIINSTTKELIGWIAYRGHPVYDFMVSEKNMLIDDIRENSETGLPYKYAYAKKNDNFFVQIGVSGDKVNDFLYRFEIQQLIKDFMGNDDVENIFFTDTNYELIASDSEKYAGITFDKKDIHEHFLLNKAKVGREFIKGSRTLHVCAPVFYNNEKIGTLTVVWSPRIINKEIKRIITDNLFRFFLTLIVFGGILHYAYRKNKSNIKIAFYDALTGLPNDEYLKEYLGERIKECEKIKTAVLLINCTDFKLINLTYGFEYGDNILLQTSKIIGNNLLQKYMAFRSEADKFILVISEYKGIEQLIDISENIINEFKKNVSEVHKHEYLNLKVAIYELEDKNIGVGQALYNVSLGIASLKNNSNKDYVIYNKEMKEILMREELIEKALIEVVSSKSKRYFRMVYQPLLDTKSNKIVGFEALARMTVEGVGQVSPLEFISLAEKRNLIFYLGNIIIKRVSGFLNLLKTSGYMDVYISVNISGLQLFRDEFISVIKQTENLSQNNRKNLIFEVTESVLVDNFKLINAKLTELKNMGISVALDDFGTGYSSLTELRDLNVGIIKIDRTFIERIGRHSEETLITPDIITMHIG